MTMCFLCGPDPPSDPDQKLAILSQSVHPIFMEDAECTLQRVFSVVTLDLSLDYFVPQGEFYMLYVLIVHMGLS